MRAARRAHRGWHQRWHHARGTVRRSLKWRLVLLFMLFALSTSAIFLAGMQSVLRGGWQGYGRPLAANYVDHLVADIGTPPSVERAQALVAALPLSIRIEGPQVNWDSHPQRRRFGPPGLDRFDADTEDEADSIQVRSLADGHRIVFGLANPAPRSGARLTGWLTLAGLLLLTLAAYATVRRLFRPIDDIRAGALRIGQGRFDAPIPVRRADELGDLAGQINTMAGALHGMLEAKRQLLLAISHELRSPLTRARVNVELIDDSPAREALLRDLGQMRDLITDLLESERLATGHAALQAEPTDLNRLVRELVEADFAGRTVDLALADELPTLSLDRARMRLLVRNLLDNAWRHGPAPGQGAAPQLQTRREADAVLLSVRDHGAGVDEAQLAQLAEPFFRTDAARQRSTGGVGLGLYLCRLVAEAHGGTLQARNATPGLVIEVRLPLAAPGMQI